MADPSDLAPHAPNAGLIEVFVDLALQFGQRCCDFIGELSARLRLGRRDERVYPCCLKLELGGKGIQSFEQCLGFLHFGLGKMALDTLNQNDPAGDEVDELCLERLEFARKRQ